MREPIERRLGRPDQQSLEALDRRLIETAARLFTEQGYAATSVDQVAAEAGAGKQTIYRRYPTKADLFKAVISEHLIGRVVQAWVLKMEALAEDLEQRAATPLEVLRQICRRTLDFMLDPDLIRLHRLIIAEERLSPVSLKDIDTSVLIFEAVIRRQLNAAIQSGEIPPQPLKYTHQVLMSMVSGWAHKQSLLLGISVSKEERDEFFDCAWSIFTNGVRGAERA